MECHTEVGHSELSGGAELVAAVKTSTEVIGVAQLALDWGFRWKAESV